MTDFPRYRFQTVWDRCFSFDKIWKSLDQALGSQRTGTANGVGMAAKKRIALVAHDSQKSTMTSWARANREVLARHELWGTGTTGALVAKATDLSVQLLKSGPLGGDQQLGAMITRDELDMLIFFMDPLAALPHDVDVKALLRISTLRQIAVACNRTSADFLVRSALLESSYNKPIEVRAG